MRSKTSSLQLSSSEESVVVVQKWNVVGIN